MTHPLIEQLLELPSESGFNTRRVSPEKPGPYFENFRFIGSRGEFDYWVPSLSRQISAAVSYDKHGVTDLVSQKSPIFADIQKQVQRMLNDKALASLLQENAHEFDSRTS